MHKEAKLSGQKRELLGSANSRRLRQRGLIPGTIYGHNQPAESIVIAEDALMPVVNGGVRVVDIELGGKVDKALFRELQWESMSGVLRHFDLMRVDPNERVKVDVAIELKGTAPGSLGGGILEQPIHKLTIDCLTYQIPDTIPVRIGALQVGQAIHVKDLELPEGVHAQAAPDAIVVHVVQVVNREALPTAGQAEPEVIGKKPTDGADDKDAAAKKK